jgi:replication factor C large subunit
MFRKNDPFGSRRALSDADVDPETAILWIDENLPYEYRESGDLVRGYEKLSRADIFLGRVHRRQYYGMWSYASEMMTAGVSLSRMNGKVSYDRLKFPSYLAKMSRSRSMRGLKSSLCYKVACSLHTSTKRVGMDVLAPLKEIAANDPGIRIMLVRDMGLEPEELGFLLDQKIDSKIVKDAFKPASEPIVPVTQYPKEFEAPPQKTAPDTTKKSPQSGLFDF